MVSTSQSPNEWVHGELLHLTSTLIRSEKSVQGLYQAAIQLPPNTMK